MNASKCKVRASESGICLSALCCTRNPLNTLTCQGPAEVTCPRCDGCAAQHCVSVKVFVHGAGSEQWKGEKAEVTPAHRRKLMGSCPASKYGPSAKD